MKQKNSNIKTLQVVKAKEYLIIKVYYIIDKQSMKREGVISD